MVIEERNRTLDYSPPPFPEDFGKAVGAAEGDDGAVVG